MDVKHHDSYFFDSQTALKVASQRNKVDIGVAGAEGLQVCYYNGQKLENEPENCINVPIDDFTSYFMMTPNRLPTRIAFENTSFSHNEIQSILESMQHTLNSIVQERERLYLLLSEEAKKLKPNFSQGLKFFLATSRQTQVLQNVTKSIAKALQQLGHEVFVSIENNGMEQMPMFLHVKNYIEFRPNVTININHILNRYLHDDVFNFVWFQDDMPSLLGTERIFTRERDYFFYLVERQKKLLEAKNIQSEHQSFCINTDVYKIRPEILREKKIVFIGSSYKQRLDGTKICEKVLNRLIGLFDKNHQILLTEIQLIASEFNVSDDYVSMLYGYIVRDYLVLQLCRQQTLFTIEIYGWGWDQYPEIMSYYKGALEYGEEISKMYNSAMYAFVPAEYALQQRTLEAASSGAIPLVYDNRYLHESDTIEKNLDSSVVYFQNIQSLIEMIEQKDTINKDLNHLLQDHTYETFVSKIIDYIQYPKINQ